MVPTASSIVDSSASPLSPSTNSSSGYKLIIRQSPISGIRLVNSAVSRLLEPPLIAQLIEIDQHGNESTTHPYPGFPLIAHLILHTATGASADNAFSDGLTNPVRMLHGEITSVCHEVHESDEEGDRGGGVGLYFVFPRVGVALEGRFCLRVEVFDLLRRESVAEARTETIDVFVEGVARANRQRSALARRLCQHGVPL